LELPSFIATVVYDQEVVWSKGYGNIDPTNTTSEPPNVDSTVRIASITKTFTGLMYAMLRDAGIVHPDDPLVKFMPQFTVKNPFFVTTR
jgi:CubicO group peptidase (beta-lactamase class C family)